MNHFRQKISWIIQAAAGGRPPHRAFIFFISLFVFSSFLYALAEERMAAGYGTGDDLVQAVATAQGDAVLNAGGKAAFVAELGNDNVVNDSGYLSNEVYLVGSAITETGESLDGVYARVKVKVTNCEDQTKKDGKILIEGEGNAGSFDEAKVLALGEMIFNAGTRIRAYGKFEDGELVKDETVFSGSGYVRDYSATELSNATGKCFVKVSAPVLPYRSERESDSEGGEDVGHASDVNLGVALAKAWKAYLASAGAGYRATRVFSAGTLTKNALEKTVTGKYGISVVSVARKGDGNAVTVSGSSESTAESPVLKGSGYGFSQGRSEAFELARVDAALGLNGDFESSSEYNHGKKVCDTVKRKAKAYVHVSGEHAVEGGIQIDTVVGKSLRDSMGGEEESVTGLGVGSTMKDALAAAKYDAMMRSAAAVDASVVYKDDKLFAGHAVEDGSLLIRSVAVKDGGSGARGRVEVEMRVLDPSNCEIDQAIVSEGYGFSDDALTAALLARADSAMNARGSMTRHSKFELGKPLEGTAHVEVRAHAGPAQDGQPIAGGVKLSASIGSSYRDVLGEMERVKGFGEGVVLSDALASAKFDALMRSAAELNVSADYKNGAMTSCLVEESRNAVIHGVSVKSEGDADGRQRQEVEMTLLAGETEESVDTIGYGFAETPAASLIIARADAALNGRGKLEKRAVFGQGKPLEGTAKIVAQAYVGPSKDARLMKSGRKIEARVGTSATVVRDDGKFSIRGEGIATTASAAVSAARHDAVRNAGMMVTASIAYHNGKSEYDTITAEGGADIRGYNNISVVQAGEQYKACVDLNLSNEGKGGDTAKSASGYGSGDSIATALKNARCDAAMAACSTVKQCYRLSPDTSLEESETGSASCYSMEDEVVLNEQAGVYSAKVNVKFSDSHRSLKGRKEKVRAKGYGATKESALLEAMKNARDKVFGRKLNVITTWNANGEPLYELTESEYKDGYIAESVEKKAKACAGGWSVEIEAVVKDRSKEEGLGFWWYVGMVVLALLVIGAFCVNPALGVTLFIVAVLVVVAVYRKFLM